MTTSEAPFPSLRIIRRINASPDRVFDALVNPEAMRKWCFTEPETRFDIDLHVGGSWTITTRRDGLEYTATGVYIDVAPPKRLEYTYSMPQFSPNSDIIAIDIASEGSGSLLTFTQSGVDIAEELRQLGSGVKGPSEEGWEMGFDALEAYLENRRDQATSARR